MPLNVPLRVSNKAQPYTPAAERNGPLQIPLQSTDVPVGAFGMNRAKALADFGQQAGQASKVMLALSQKLQNERDDAWSDQQFSSFLDWSSDYSNNPDYGVYSKKGENAQNVVSTAAQDYDKKIDTLLSKAPSLQAQQFLEAKVRQARNADMGMFARHSANELRSWRLEMKSTAVDKAIDGMIGKYTADPRELEAMYAEQIGPQLADLSAMTGKPVETLEYETKGKLFASVIEMNADSDQLGRASALLGQWKDFIPAKLQVKLQSHIKARGEALAEKGRAASARAEREAARVAGTLEGDTINNWVASGQMTEGQALQEIEAMNDGTDKGYLRYQMVHNRFAALRTAQKFKEQAEFEQGFNEAYTGLSRFVDDPVGADEFAAKIPDRRVREKLRGTLREIRSGNGMRADTDARVWSAAMDAIYYAEPGKGQTKQELRAAFAGEMTPAAFKQLEVEFDKSTTVDQKIARLAYIAANGKEGDFSLGMFDKQIGKGAQVDFKKFYKQINDLALSTHRAMEQDWVERAAINYMRGGEAKPKEGEWLHTGRGPDVKRYDIRGDTGQTFNLTDEEKSIIESKLKANPALKADLAKEFGKGYEAEGYAIRLDREQMGPRKKAKVK